MTATNEAQVREEVLAASSAWLECFSNKDAAGCAAGYTEDAILVAHPVGQSEGREAIQAFWADLFQKNPGQLVYSNTRVTVVSDTAALIAADWKMDIAQGYISKELWLKGEDGVWRLAEDEFTITGMDA